MLLNQRIFNCPCSFPSDITEKKKQPSFLQQLYLCASTIPSS